MPRLLPRPTSSALALAIALAFSTTPALAQSAPPAAAASAASTDDPYLWLEKVDSPEAMGWVKSENAKTLSVLEKDPRFAGFHEQALALSQSRERIPVAEQIDGGLWNLWQDAEHVRGIWRVATPRDYDAGGDPAWKTVLDLDKLAASEHANWVWKGARCVPGHENRCLLRLSDGGEDAVTVREFDLRRGAVVAGGFELPKGKQDAAWDGLDQVVVAREWAAGELTTSGYPYVVKRLRRGAPLSAAVEIFRGQASDMSVSPEALDDGRGHRALVVVRMLSFFESEKYLVTPTGAKKLALPPKCDIEALYDGQLVVRLKQDWQAGGVAVPAGALVAIDLARATAAPQALHPVVIVAPTARQSIASAAPTRGGLVVTSLDNVRGRAAVYTRGRGGCWTATPLALPDNSRVDLNDASTTTGSAYLTVSGYLQPSSQWLVDARTGAVRRLRSLPAQFDAAREAVEQFEATSSDGTKIPYFVVHPKDMALDGSHPAILYAYGGFSASQMPSYSPVMGKLWLEHGGVWVLANIRGGGEFGPAWHDAGLKTKRQAIYDDFAAVGRDLVARGITTPRRLGIMGGSNGGLLMGVQMTQHPELWNAVDIQVPLLDMLRFEQIAAGASWVGEYGSVSVPEERAFLAGISPYNQLQRGKAYPQALVWTTTKDDRVGPQHARKFAARLAEYGIPYYYYEVIEGGHGAGANLREKAHTNAIEYVYFTRQLMDR